MARHISPVLLQTQHHDGWQSPIAVILAVVIVVLSWQWLFGKRQPEPLPLDVPIPEACKEGYWDDYDASKNISIQNLRDDEIPCTCPADGRPLGTFKAQDKDTIDLAVRKCQNAQPEWANTSFAQRRQVLASLLKYVLDHQEEIVTACCLDSGKTRLDAYFGEILVTVEKLKWTIEHGEKALRPSRRPTNFLMFYKHNEVRYEPLGVVSACVSWNYPFHNFISPIISAIFAGNAIVVKPSEQVAWSSVYFTNIVQEAISACGYNSNIVQTIICLPELADHLTSHPGISQITFIGSREVAHKVCASAAKALTPVTVELGGKDAAIVLDDKKTITNLEDVAKILMRGVFQNAGQNCIGIERVIALPGVYEKLIDIVKPKIEKLKIGSVMLDERMAHGKNGQLVADLDGGASQGSNSSTPGSQNGVEGETSYVTISAPNYNPTVAASNQTTEKTPSSHIDTHLPSTTDLGAMISPKSFSKLSSLISSAVSQGAILHHGGTPFSHPRYPHGHYFTPTLLTSATSSMEITQQELFAPVFLLMRATSLYHAIELANSTPYALGASVFGYDAVAVQKCIKEVKSGMISVNDFAAYYAVSLPFGGIKGSGYGRFGGEEGLRALCNVRAVCRDKWTGLIETKIPGIVDLPTPKGGKDGGSLRARDMVSGIIETGYGLTLKDRIKGVSKILKASQR